jgi:membrane-bound metal-dependent hydrolase YbcI (DUF457 family)
MTPAGHLSVSYILGRALKNIPIPAIIIGGIMPDLDFLFIFFEWFNQAHRVVTHNIAFVFLAAAAAMLAAPGGQKKAAAIGIVAGGLLHLFIDSVMDNNSSNGIGIAFLWPFYDGFFSPFNFLELQHRATWKEPFKMIGVMLPVLLYELPFYMTALFVLYRRKTQRALPRVS